MPGERFCREFASPGTIEPVAPALQPAMPAPGTQGTAVRVAGAPDGGFRSEFPGPGTVAPVAPALQPGVGTPEAPGAQGAA